MHCFPFYYIVISLDTYCFSAIYNIKVIIKVNVFLKKIGIKNGDM